MARAKGFAFSLNFGTVVGDKSSLSFIALARASADFKFMLLRLPTALPGRVYGGGGKLKSSSCLANFSYFL